MSDADDLQRFVAAQAGVMEAVRAELRAGRKRTHWMWFVFPQLRGLGTSDAAWFYGLAGRREAEDFLGHEVLGPNLFDCVALAAGGSEADPRALFGAPDDLKFRSCLTLFDAVAPAQPAFAAALRRFFGGVPDARTLAMLRGDRA